MGAEGRTLAVFALRLKTRYLRYFLPILHNADAPRFVELATNRRTEVSKNKLTGCGSTLSGNVNNSKRVSATLSL